MQATATKIFVGIVAMMLVILMVPAAASAAKRPAPLTPKVVITCVQTNGVEQITDAFTGVNTGTHTEQTKLYSPDGGLYQTFTLQFAPTSGAYTATHYMPIVGTWAERLAGMWTVKVYLDGVLRGTSTFSI